MLHFLFFFFFLIGVNGGFLHMPSPASTIPTFPEQSAVSACPLDLPDALFPSVARACSASGGGMPPRSRCCPTLAAWLYSAYSPAALRQRAGPEYDDMPLLPDDTETCVAELGKAMAAKKVELPRPNSTCDLAYCYCGIRLHPFTCPAAGEPKALPNLELHCKSDNNGTDCSNCLRALYQVTASTFSFCDSIGVKIEALWVLCS